MTNANLPTVDVVIPCYNYAHYLERCIQSVLRQEGVNVRALIIDDKSPDNTAEVGQRLAAEHPQVEYIRNDPNRGLVGTANRGLFEWVTATYCIVLSADDALNDGALARATRVMDLHPNVGMAYGWARVFSDESEMDGHITPEPFEYQVIPGADFINKCCESWCSVASPTAVIRTSVQHQVGEMNPKLTATCDVEIWMRIATVSDIAALDTLQAFYRRHEANMSTGYTYRPMSDLREQHDTIRTVVDGQGSHLPQAPDWIQTMTDRLLLQSAWLAGIAWENGDDKGVEICRDFARELSADWEESKPWKRFKMKRMIGRQVLSGMRKLSGKQRRYTPHNPFVPGQMFGWQPELPGAERKSLSVLTS